ncbi:MAG: HmuY family protein [Myxococcota bacterium]
MTRPTLFPALALAVLACTDAASDDETGTPDAPPEVLELTVDGTAPAYVDFAKGEVLGLDADGATTDTTWDLAFLGTTIRVNSGPSGPGSAGVGLMATPEGLYDESGAPVEAAFQMATAKSTLELFLSDLEVPSPEPDEITSVFDDTFYNYNAATGDLSEDDTVGYLVRLANGTDYARVRVTNIDFLTRNGKGIESFTIEVEPSLPPATDTPAFGPSVPFTGAIPAEGALCFDLETEATVACEGADWDLSFGFFGRTTFIYTNGGDLGPGQGASLGPIDWVELQDYPSATEDAQAQDLTNDFESDRFVGPFDVNPWFAMFGKTSRPNYRVYYLDPNDDGDAYVLQILGAEDGTTDGPTLIRYYAL